jgi:hypothetical protein
LVTLYSQNGDTTETGNTVHGGDSIRSRNPYRVETLQSQWRHYTLKYTIHLKWRHYVVQVDTVYRVETLYAQIQYTFKWRHYAVQVDTVYRLETLCSPSRYSVQSGDTMQSK